MRANQTLKKDGIEVILWPQTFFNLSQGFDNSRLWLSHEGTYALDNGGKAPIYAPVSLMCMGRYNLSKGNELLFQSLEKVLFADGSVDYLTLDIWHSNDISKIKVGSIFRQGELICVSGNNGIGNGGEHLHIEAGKGKPRIVAGSTPLVYSKGMTHFASGNFHPGMLPNAVDPRNVFHLNDTVINNTFDMKFKSLEVLKDGWLKDEKNNCWYYYENGRMVKNDDRWIDGKYYHFNANGIMAAHEFIAYIEKKTKKKQYFYVGWDGAMLIDTKFEVMHDGRISFDAANTK